MRIVKIILGVCFAAGLVSCSPKPQEIIIGKWTHDPSPPPPFGTQVQLSGPGVMTFEFRADGTVITQGGVEVSIGKVDGNVGKQGGSQPITNGYSLVDDHTLRIAFAKGERFQGREVTFKMSASRNQIVLTEVTPSGLVDLAGPGGILTLQRVK